MATLKSLANTSKGTKRPDDNTLALLTALSSQSGSTDAQNMFFNVFSQMMEQTDPEEELNLLIVEKMVADGDLEGARQFMRTGDIATTSAVQNTGAQARTEATVDSNRARVYGEEGTGGLVGNYEGTDLFDAIMGASEGQAQKLGKIDQKFEFGDLLTNWRKELQSYGGTAGYNPVTNMLSTIGAFRTTEDTRKQKEEEDIRKALGL